jgi:hypothetical protein
MSRYSYPQPRPVRRPGSKRARIEQALLAELDGLRAQSENGRALTTGRFLYYRLVSNGTIAKKEIGKKGGRRPDQDVSLVLSELRWAGVVGFDEIADRSRGIIDGRGYENFLEGAVAAIGSVRLDPWDGVAPLLIVESDSLAGLLERSGYEYRVPLVPSRGQASDGLVYDVVGLVEAGYERVLYVGDLDLSGGQIEDAFQDRVEALAGIELDWRRVALREEQRLDNELPVIQKWDGRLKRYFPAVETEALDQRILLPLIDEALRELLPAGALERAERQEQQQRAQALAALRDGGEE